MKVWMLAALMFMVSIFCAPIYAEEMENTKEVKPQEQDYEFFVKSKLSKITPPRPEIEVPQIPQFESPRAESEKPEAE